MNAPNAPTPVTPAPSDPTTPGTQGRPTALGAAVTGAVVGTPLAITAVWLLETFGTAHGAPLKFDEYTATAVGGVAATVLGYFAQVIQGFVAVLQEKLTRP